MHTETLTSPINTRQLTLLLAAMAALETMAIDLYLPAFPAIQHDFGISANATQSSMSVFLIGMALGQLALGPLLDRYGRRAPILFGLAAFVVGSALCAIAPNYPLFLTGRVLQSLGAATGMVAPRAIITDVFPLTESAKVMSIIMQIMMIAPVISPVFGALLLTHLGWRANFYFLALCALGLALLIWRLLPETLPRSARTSHRVFSMLGAYIGVLRNRRFTLLMLSNGFCGGLLYTFLGAAPFAFMQDYQLVALMFGLSTAALSMVFIVGGALNIRLLGRRSETSLLTSGLWLQLASLATLSVYSCVTQPPLWAYLASLSIVMFALGFIVANVSALAMADSGPNAGTASGAFGVAFSLISASAGVALAVTGTGYRGLAIAMAIFAALSLIAKEAAIIGAHTAFKYTAE